MLLPQLLKHEILVMVMVMIMTVPDNISGHTTCTAITTAYNTSVTCLFGEDISKLSFNVQFFSPNTSVDPEMTLLCNKLMSGELTCHKESQVLFDEKEEIFDRFTLSRPRSLTKVNVGYYQCHAVPSLREKSEFCPLTYEDVPLESPHPQTLPPKIGSDAIQTFTMVAIVIILILFIVMIIAGVCLWTKRKSVFLWWSRRTAQRRSHLDVEDARENDECIALSTLSSERLQHTELPTCPLIENDKDQDEDKDDVYFDSVGELRHNRQSPQLASQNAHPAPATTFSQQHPATSPGHPEIQPSQTGSVEKTSMLPSCSTEDLPVEKATDAMEDNTLMTDEHEAEPNMEEHGVGDEIEMDKKAKRKKLKADKKAEKEKLKADKEAEKEKLKADKEAEKEKLKADKEAEKEKKEADKKAKKEEKRSGRESQKDKNRDRRGSQREGNVMDPQESSNKHETHTVV